MRKLGSAFLAIAALTLTAVAAQAGEALFSPLSNGAPGPAKGVDRSFQALAADPATRSLHLVQVHPAVLDEARPLTLPLEPGLDLRVHRVDSYRTRSGMLVWSGVIEDSGAARQVPIAPEKLRFDPTHSVMLVKNGDRITGNIHFEGRWYKIRPLRTGGHAVVEVDTAALPAEHPPEFVHLPTIRMPRGAAGKSNTIIRAMVHYTPASALFAGDIDGLIELAVAETNQGYTSSGVNITLELAHKSQVTYVESGTFDVDLLLYRGTSDFVMDEVHATRNAVAADVGILIINNPSFCGLASGIGSTAATAFAAVYWDCATGYYSFAHEIGHLQSARHDPANDPSTTPFARPWLSTPRQPEVAHDHGLRLLGRLPAAELLVEPEQALQRRADGNHDEEQQRSRPQ